MTLINKEKSHPHDAMRDSHKIFSTARFSFSNISNRPLRFFEPSYKIFFVFKWIREEMDGVSLGSGDESNIPRRDIDVLRQKILPHFSWAFL